MSTLSERLAAARRAADAQDAERRETQQAQQDDPAQPVQPAQPAQQVPTAPDAVRTDPLSDPLFDPLDAPGTVVASAPPARRPAAPAPAPSPAPTAATAPGLVKPSASRATVAPRTEARRTLASGQADRLDELKSSVHVELLKQLGPHLYDADMDQNELDQRVRAVLSDVLGSQDRPLSTSDRARVTQEISDDILGYGPIEPYLRDPDVSEVMVNSHAQIYLEKQGRLVAAETSFTDEAHLRRIIDKIVSRIGRRVDEASPMVDARLPDGSRVNAVIPPLAIDGSSLTIRKFSADPLTINDLINFGSLSPQTADFLEACVRGRLNIIVAGGTGSGKTTTLNVLSSFIPSDERIVTIEDAAELQLKQDHVVRLESRPSNIEGKGAVTIRDLVRNSLRMRPDRIIVGEVRDASALDMLQAMNTGHDGSICTLHSNSPRDALSRMETMVLMAGMDLPIRAIREQIASAVDLVVHQTRFKDGSRRITHITEVERMEGDVITMQDVFVFDTRPGFDADGRTLGRMRPTGLRPKFLEKMAEVNVHVDPIIFASDRR
ncbi:CpaF family protein [Nocardioides rubriscoriae]|uniref:CpaF family protein n=1 Tax=Nocardioides rubriscoriae TaxID=642762 RepID=UPI001FE93394|nr:CpaF family protein [Nocardioides rubriscoriae]